MMDQVDIDEWVRSCLRKKRYDTRELADQVRGARQGKPGARAKLRSYFCHHCSGWHLTHRPQPPSYAAVSPHRPPGPRNGQSTTDTTQERTNS